MDSGTLGQRRAMEDRAVELGTRRRELLLESRENARAIGALADQAANVGVGMATLARLIGVSRQTLYAWIEIAKEDHK